MTERPTSDRGASDRTAIRSESAPAAIGPYSQAIRGGGMLFLSGQIGLDPATGALVPGGTAAEARRALMNLRAVLAAAGASPGHVVRTTIYLVDLADFQAVNEVYAGFFPAPPPARTTIGVASLPKGARVEIDAIALARAEG
ncbi:MAG: RidA family protein [Planctomycetes bacterium]|nr:RidA family protein [Planctomycetota bacterium]